MELMLPIRLITGAACGVISIIATASGASLPSQGAPPFDILSIPAPTFGTCVPLQPRDSTRSASHLVIKSIPPGSSRDIIVIADTGRSLTYSDRVFVMQATGSGTGRSVIAFRDQAGRMIGFVHEIEATSSALPSNVAAVRALRDSAKSSGSGRALSVAEARKVSAVITALRKRCPG